MSIDRDEQVPAGVYNIKGEDVEVYSIDTPHGPISLTAGMVRERAAIGVIHPSPDNDVPDGHRGCPVCDAMFLPPGARVHLQAHQRMIGDIPKYAAPAKKGEGKRGTGSRSRAKTKRSPKPEMTVEDGCIGLLLGLTGSDKIDLKHLPAVMRWVRQTEALMVEVGS